MYAIRRLVALTILFAVSSSVLAAGTIDTSRLSLVDENHAEISKNDEVYILDSYIILFERPYYIHVRKLSDTPLTGDEASSIAVEYIEPRGCTTPVARRSDLDQVNTEETQWLIGVEC